MTRLAALSFLALALAGAANAAMTFKKVDAYDVHQTSDKWTWTDCGESIRADAQRSVCSNGAVVFQVLLRIPFRLIVSSSRRTHLSPART
jgi:hypothetical protein